eukprot:GHVU01081013.1.p1 GENE.GHVU01081013.1~~GHVU01081013.1.p1  ORF type:complete len:147 (+),score=44.08 GHVU01081013.1:330-770(+)
MSDAEDNTALEVVQEEEEDTKVEDLDNAVRVVLKKALANGSLVRGIHETAKALEAKKVQVCFLSSEVDDANYTKLIQALCKANQVPCLEAPERKKLGQWAGLCRVDEDGKPRKTVAASVVAVTDYGEPNEGLSFLENHLKTLAETP